VYVKGMYHSSEYVHRVYCKPPIISIANQLFLTACITVFGEDLPSRNLPYRAGEKRSHGKNRKFQIYGRRFTLPCGSALG